ncbi:MAG: glycoside hydrolase family protein [Lachnospiraceae bacterium]|jgi:GH24 family phage-related lysozyme (muramidase)|nr:glycoside hydrolase family protein [Lachnospiraceae bacterium]
MNISQPGMELIKKYEGCRLEAYLCPANVWTVGYGHTGPDVYRGMKITQPVAEQLLRNDLKNFESAVHKTGLTLNQNQFDALVSFAYNCGAGNLKTLIKNRTNAQIADALLLYTKAAGKELAGLVKRRREERTLFLSSGNEGVPANTAKDTSKDNSNVTAGSTFYPMPSTNLTSGSKGNGVRWLQTELNRHGYNLSIDGDFGPKTLAAVRDYQENNDLVIDGIVGRLTRIALGKR